jgi:transposase InsO family protein
MIIERGDPCTGYWHFCKEEPWTLYTDASLAAYGAVLMIGNVIVEDQTYLRAPNDRRHINLAELIAVQKGLHLVSLYQKALNVANPFVLQLKCDNKSVVAWLTRAKQRHWTSIKGLNAKVIEKTLLQVADDCKAMKVRLDVELIASEKNISDPLSRIPDFLKAPEEPFDSTAVEDVICTVIEQPNPQLRDEFNRIIVDQRTLKELLDGIHEHEGAQALYDRVRLIVSYPTLRKECQNYVRNCAVCSMSKVTRHTPILSGDAHMEAALSPFSQVHLDIAGPYGSLDDIDKFYVMSMVDRHSRYVLTRPTCNPPTAMDAAALLRVTFERFHVCVDVVHTDGGSQFISAEFARAATDVGARVQTTPVRSSWANGRVERWHRILNDRLRAFLGDGLESNSFKLFDNCVARATLVYNTAPSTRSGTSPHEVLFTFDAWIYPKLRHFRPPPSLSLDMSETVPPPAHPHSRKRLPNVGETWLYKLPSPKKLDRPYAPCRIIKKLSVQTYRIRTRNKRLKKVHLRFLKFLTPEAAAQLPEVAALPEDPRPLRDLSRGGGHVED